MNNSQNNNKPKLIMLIGIPGSGKTFFGQKFAKEYKIPFLNINQIRHLMFENPEYDKIENEKITVLSIQLLNQLFKTNQSILFEANLGTRVSRKAYSKLAIKNGYQPMFIWVKSLADESKYRSLIKNPKTPKDFTISDQLFDKLSAQFTPPNKTEPTIVISGKHAFKNQYKMVLKKIAGEPKPQPKISFLSRSK